MDAHPEDDGQLLQRLDQTVHPALDIESAEAIFDVGNNIKGRRRPVGVRAVIGGITVEELDDAIVAEKALDPAVDRAHGVDGGQGEQSGEMAAVEQLLPFVDRREEKNLGSKVVDPAAVGHKTLKPAAIPLREHGDGAFHSRGIAAGVEPAAIRVKIAAHRLDRHQVEELPAPETRPGEELFQHKGHGEQRRPGVETEALPAHLVHLAAKAAVLLEEVDAESPPRQFDGAAQSRQSPPDYGHLFSHADSGTFRKVRYSRGGGCSHRENPRPGWCRSASRAGRPDRRALPAGRSDSR